MKHKLVTCILAAGNGRRFGGAKQAALIDGIPMVRRVFDTVSNATKATTLPAHADEDRPSDNAVAFNDDSNIAVVVGAHADAVQEALSGDDVHLIENSDWAEGMAAGIRKAVEYAGSHNADALLLICGDQPLVNENDLKALIDHARANPEQIIAARYSGISGIPAVFPRWCFSELLELTGDRGAKPLLAKHLDKVQPIDCPNAAFDVDTEATLEMVSQKLQALRERSAGP